MEYKLVVRVACTLLGAAAVVTPMILHCSIDNEILGYSDLAPGLWTALLLMTLTNFYVHESWSALVMAIAALLWWSFSAQTLRSNCHKNTPGPALWLGWSAIAISAWTHR